ncbi:hypothetical protein BJV78DRAFT_1151982 [Lactifluus subvellereus]|nr:hypothetical protein BJV78DRAFT_1151982 [Lactifluus subvellereus]
MPITYPRSSPRRPSYFADVSDADESIVLSDLVRSGEVSRLRRRGAIAIRDSTVPQSPVPLALPAPPAPPTTSGTNRHSSVSLLPLPPHPEPDLSETDDDDAEQRQGGFGRWFIRSRLSLRELSASEFNDPDPLLFPSEADAHPEDEDEDSSYVLFCGGRLRECDWYSPSNAPRAVDPPTRYRASAFRPLPPSRRPSYPRARRTNGCGVLIHLSAQPRRRQGTWVACGAAAETVVRMDARYFDCCAAVKMIKSACGGNPLGIVYVPCQAAADGLNITRPPSSMTPSTSRNQPTQNVSSVHLSGPNSWLPGVDSCQRRRHAETTEVYNFFSESVRPAPEFTFPPSSPSETVPSRPTQPLPPVASATSTSLRPPVSSAPVRQWINGLSMRSVETIQALNSPGDGQTEEVTHSVDNTPQEDEMEGDGAEKPEDSGPGGGGQIPWAER